MTVSRMLAGPLRVIALMSVLFAAAVASAEPYKLQPGDTIGIAITELPALDIRSAIDIDGNLQVPRIGLFAAAGQTLAELQGEIGLAAAGKTIPIYTVNGERQQVTLAGTEIALEIAAYRPVYVTGDVARPGTIDFQPGMSVRAAIAAVGGIATVPTLFEDALEDAPELQASYQTTSLEHAANVVRLWGIDATSRGEETGEAHLAVPVHVADAAVSRFFDLERRRVALTLSEARTSRASLSDRYAYLTESLKRLEGQLSNAETALGIEEEDVERVRQLNAKGLAAASRLSDARQALLLVSSRLVSAQDSVAALTVERSRLGQELDTFDERFEQPLIEERSQVLQNIWALESKLASVRRSLELNGQTVEAFGIRLKPAVSIAIVRSAGADPSPTPVPGTLDTTIMPGDVVEVDVEYDYASLEFKVEGTVPEEPSQLPDAPARPKPEPAPVPDEMAKEAAPGPLESDPAPAARTPDAGGTEAAAPAGGPNALPPLWDELAEARLTLPIPPVRPIR